MSVSPKENGIYPPAISGLRSGKRKRQDEPPTSNKKTSSSTQRANARAAAAHQSKLASDVIAHMEAIYGDLFDRMRCGDLVIDGQGDTHADLKEQPPEVIAFVQELTNSALRMGEGIDHWQVAAELRGTYLIAVLASGYEFLKPTGLTIESGEEGEEQCHQRTSVLKSAISRSSGPQMRYYCLHATAAIWGRYHQIATAHGWKTLAVLLHSWSFWLAVRGAAPDLWERLMIKIGENTMSLQLLGSFYCDGWANAMKEALPEGVDLLTEDERREYPGNYHNWRIPSDTAARVCEPIEPPFNVVDTSNWWDYFEKDPRAEMTPQTPDPESSESSEDSEEIFDVEGPCISCGQLSPGCQCNLENWSPARVELFNTGHTGTGVRALQKFKKGQLLGEYVGDIIHNSKHGDDDSSEDDPYTLWGHLGQKSKYATSSKQNGNWIRFVNHSCEANCSIEYIQRRGKVLSAYRVEKDIKMFEEITTNYGASYFIHRGLKCLCTAKKHLAGLS